MVKVAVLDYGIGNLRSAQKAFEISGAEARLTADRDLVLASDGVVLPGVGNFGKCAKALTDSCLLYTSPSPRDATLSRMPSSA